MTTGVMYHTEGKPLAEAIPAAVQHVQEKYGERPVYILVPLGADVKGIEVSGAAIVESQYIMPNHVWLGGR